MNFYQSGLWKDLQSDVFGRDVFEETIFGKTYWWVKRSAKRLGLSFATWQILGVELPEDPSLVQKGLQILYSKYKKEKWAVYFQLGVIDEIGSLPCGKKKPTKEDVQAVVDEREDLQKYISSFPHMEVWFRENMPLSTIIYDLTLTPEEQIAAMKPNTRRAYQASLDHVTCGILEPPEYEIFYYQWKEVSQQKGFGIMTYEQFYKMADFLVTTKQ